MKLFATKVCITIYKGITDNESVIQKQAKGHGKMKFIKLKEYCESKSISYASGNRWFKKGLIPGTYQTGTGTILVPSEDPEAAEKGDNAMSMFLKKTVEFSKNEGSIEDFAAWVLSTFSLKSLNSAPDAPKYSRVKPNPEDIQKHFQQFIPKGEKPKPCCANPEDMDESKSDEAPSTVAVEAADNAANTTPEISAMAAELSNVIGNPSYASPVFYPSAGSVPMNGTITNLCSGVPSTICSVLPYVPNAEVSVFNGAISTNCALSSLTGGTNFTATNTILTSGQTSSPDGLYFMQTSPQITDETEKSPERAKPGRKPASYYKNKETK